MTSLDETGFTVKEYSRLFWTRISPSGRTEHHFKLSVSGVAVDGGAADSNLVAIEQEKGTTRPMDAATGQGKRLPKTWLEAVVERDLDKTIVKAVKSGSGASTGALGLLSGLGGLFALLYLIFLGLTTLLTRGKMENYLVSELFQPPAEEDDTFGAKDKAKDEIQARKSISWQFYNEVQGAGEQVLDASSVNPLCMGSDRMAQIFTRGQELVNQELNITRLVGSVRIGDVMKKRLAEMSSDNRRSLAQAQTRNISRQNAQEMLTVYETNTEREEEPLLEEDDAANLTAQPMIEIKEEVVLLLDESNDNEDPKRVVEAARAQDMGTRFDRSRMTINEKGELVSASINNNSAVRISFADAKLLEPPEEVESEGKEEVVANPATKLDEMFTFLKINFTTLWGSDEPKDDKAFEARVYKIKMQLEGIDEERQTKIDIAELRTEIERLRESAMRDSISADFNPQLLVDNLTEKKSKRKREKSKGRNKVEKNVELFSDREVNQSADFGGDNDNVD